jgi:hypothetical protein
MTLHKSLAGAVALAILIPGAALAHHGWSSYDAEKTLTVTGPLTDVAWRNPAWRGEDQIRRQDLGRGPGAGRPHGGAGPDPGDARHR